MDKVISVFMAVSLVIQATTAQADVLHCYTCVRMTSDEECNTNVKLCPANGLGKCVTFFTDGKSMSLSFFKEISRELSFVCW